MFRERATDVVRSWMTGGLVAIVLEDRVLGYHEVSWVFYAFAGVHLLASLVDLSATGLAFIGRRRGWRA